MRTRIVHSLEDIAPGDWNALEGTRSPFLRHEFLVALERNGCIGRATGWDPAYVTLVDEHGLAGAVPAYVKSHSYGEFVFDFSWARAYQSLGRRYYPKLTIAAPFTPATGARLLVRPGLDPAATKHALIEAVQAHARERNYSSVHALFLAEADRDAFAGADWLSRRDCQFHWTNRGYESFDHYLESFTAEKRKKAKRERRRVAEAGIAFETRLGADLDEATLDSVYAFHRDTFHRHGHEPYLTRAFFGEIARTMGEALMVKIAVRHGTPVAAAIFFWEPGTLYGRYWGASGEFNSLHFEACYHQGIEFCIERRIARFEPGTQGEHKVARGFEPTLTWSAHSIADVRLREAIEDYLGREGAAVEAYAAEIGEHVPFRQAERDGSPPESA